MATNTYKLILVGDGGVGKTTFAKKCRSGEFEPMHFTTFGVEMHSVKFETTDGQRFSFSVWDTAGQERLGVSGDGYNTGGHCAIAMCNYTPSTHKNLIQKWIPGLKRVCGEIPIVIVGNMQDLNSYDQCDFGVSTKDDTKDALLAPFLYLAQTLTGNPALELKPTPA